MMPCQFHRFDFAPILNKIHQILYLSWKHSCYGTKLNETDKHITVMPMTILLLILNGNNQESILIELNILVLEINNEMGK